jgi:hypothetical protein
MAAAGLNFTNISQAAFFDTKNHIRTQSFSVLTAFSWRTLAYQEVILRIGPLAKLIEAM